MLHGGAIARQANFLDHYPPVTSFGNPQDGRCYIATLVSHTRTDFFDFKVGGHDGAY